jgi:Plasmid pRiA4b ORF-3-like protein
MSADTIARLKISLDDAKPAVLRRVEVPFDIRLDRLHLTIQAAMGWLEIGFRFPRIGLARQQRDFPSHAMNFGLEPPFLSCFDSRHRFVDATPSVIELAEFCIGSRQIWQPQRYSCRCSR